MSNSVGFVADVNVVPFDAGHDIDDSGTDVEEGVAVEVDALLCHARLARTTMTSAVMSLLKPWKLTCWTHYRSDLDPSQARDQETTPILVRRLQPPESTKASSSLS